MITEYKSLLRGAELLAGACAVLGLASGFLVMTNIADPTLFERLVFYSFAAMFAAFGTAILVAAEYTQTTRAGQSWWRRAQGLSSAELRALVHWCPRWILYFALSGAASAFAISLSIGEVSWSPGQPFTDREAIGFTVGQSTFCFLSWPVLASASRMPGNFAIHYGT